MTSEAPWTFPISETEIHLGWHSCNPDINSRDGLVCNVMRQLRRVSASEPTFLTYTISAKSYLGFHSEYYIQEPESRTPVTSTHHGSGGGAVLCRSRTRPGPTPISARYSCHENQRDVECTKHRPMISHISCEIVTTTLPWCFLCTGYSVQLRWFCWLPWLDGWLSPIQLAPSREVWYTISWYPKICIWMISSV